MKSIFDTESKIIHLMGSNKFIIAKIKCWPVFKQEPGVLSFAEVFFEGLLSPNYEEVPITTVIAVLICGARAA